MGEIRTTPREDTRIPEHRTTDDSSRPAPSTEAEEEGKYVYCIIRSARERDFGPIGIGEGNGHVYTVHYGDLAAVVSDTPIRILRSHARERPRPRAGQLLRDGVEYRCEIAPDLPVLRTDRTKLRQILLNLVSNAVKFTHAGSVTVTAELLSSGEGVRIRVADTGIGIAEEHLETIFDDFRQVDQTPTREYGGTGLGLAISRRLLRLLGGRISVRSEKGRGSTFTVELPIELEGPAEAQVGREHAEAGRGRRRAVEAEAR